MDFSSLGVILVGADMSRDTLNRTEISGPRSDGRVGLFLKIEVSAFKQAKYARCYWKPVEEVLNTVEQQTQNGAV